MFEKRKEARALKKNEDVATLLAVQEVHLKKIDKAMAEIENTADAARKILMLESVDSAIRRASYDAYTKREKIIKARAKQKSGLSMIAGGGVGAAAVAIPAIVAFPPLGGVAFLSCVIGAAIGASTEGRIEKSQRKRLAEQNPAVDGFDKVLDTQSARAAEIRAETEQSCDLEETSLSPHFEAALGKSEVLRGRFASATAKATRQAREEKSTAQQAPTVVKETVKEKQPHQYPKIV